MPRYFGPFLIVDRPSKSTIAIETGTYRDGRKKVEIHHWKNARPAFVGTDQPLAVRPPPGRHPKLPPTRLEPPEPTDVISTQTFPPIELTSQNQNNPSQEFSPRNFESPSPVPDADDDINSPTETPIEMTEQNSSYWPPTPAIQQNAESEPAPNRPIRSTRGIPHPKYQDYATYSAWSASSNDLAVINNSINFRPQG